MTVEIRTGDCLDLLRLMPSESVQCVVTSPPYFGLRDYDVAGQIGLEPTVEAYIAKIVGVFREVRRALRKDGTLWLNLGDSFSSGGKGGGAEGSKQRSNVGALIAKTPTAHGFKVKNLLMIPARAAIALQSEGFYLRSDIIWSKPNPMPESCRDRPTSAHEHVFLLTKSPRYYYDADAIREPSNWTADGAKIPGGWDLGAGAHGTINRAGRTSAQYQKTDKQRGHSRRHAGFTDRWDAMEKAEQCADGANARNVWTIATQPYSDAHFATFPPALVEKCILAGTKPGDTVLDPFGGAGTTGLVADRLQRNAVLLELNPDYVALAHRRIAADRGPLGSFMEAAE